MRVPRVAAVFSAVFLILQSAEARLQPPWTLSLEHAASERLGGGDITSYALDVLREAADASVERLVIRQCGLLLPRVSIGSPSLLFIQQGSGVVELIDDNGQTPADVSPITVNGGDAAVIPKGWTYSVGNYLNESPELIITAVRFSHHKQKSYLAGSRPHSVLAGFSLHILETAFNQQHDVVRALLRQATGGGIIVSHCVPPSPPTPAAEENSPGESAAGEGAAGGEAAGDWEEIGTGRGVAGMRMGLAEGEVEVGEESKKGKGGKKEMKGRRRRGRRRRGRRRRGRRRRGRRRREEGEGEEGEGKEGEEEKRFIWWTMWQPGSQQSPRRGAAWSVCRTETSRRSGGQH
ncbi:hypothetical protein CLOP_g7116, partial [Closterium sp. NIES-67]